MSDTLFDLGPATVTTAKERPDLSADARRTIRNRELIAAGVHPATRQPILITGLTWTDCGHNAWRNGIVMDPFAGSGTTLAAAVGLGRDAIGIDLDERNVHLARERVGMFLTEAERTPA